MTPKRKALEFIDKQTGEFNIFADNTVRMPLVSLAIDVALEEQQKGFNKRLRHLNFLIKKLHNKSEKINKWFNEMKDLYEV